MGAIRKLTGQIALPVLRFGDEIVDRSARIIDELERRPMGPSLSSPG
jgi:hypothetical protein